MIEITKGMSHDEVVAIYPHAIDICVPTYLTENDRIAWRKFFKYVEDSPIHIIINNGYFYYVDRCELPQDCNGNGDSFYFWFKTIADREQFISDIFELFNWKPTMNVTLEIND